MTNRKWRIVVFEDCDLDFTLLERGLAGAFPKEEFSLERFVYGEEGLKALDEATVEVPDCLFIDLGLPGMSGGQVLDKLRADQRFANTPVFVLSGLPEAFEVTETAKRGALGVISKDYDARAFAPWANWLKKMA